MNPPQLPLLPHLPHLPRVAGLPYYIPQEFLDTLPTRPMDDAQLDEIVAVLLAGVASQVQLRLHVEQLAAEARRAREQEMRLHDQAAAQRQAIEERGEAIFGPWAPLCDAQKDLARTVVAWVRVVLGEGRPLPATGDIDHSALLRRMRAGRPPMPVPPPTSYGQPWYELVERGEACPVAVVSPDRVAVGAGILINDCAWEIVDLLANDRFVVPFGRLEGEFVLDRVPDAAQGLVWRLRRLGHELEEQS